MNIIPIPNCLLYLMSFSLVKSVPNFRETVCATWIHMAPRFLPAWRSRRKLRSRWMVGYHPLCFAIESMFVNVRFWQSLDFAKAQKLLVVTSGHILFNSDSRNSPLLVDFLYSHVPFHSW